MFVLIERMSECTAAPAYHIPIRRINLLTFSSSLALCMLSHNTMMRCLVLPARVSQSPHAPYNTLVRAIISILRLANPQLIFPSHTGSMRLFSPPVSFKFILFPAPSTMFMRSYLAPSQIASSCAPSVKFHPPHSLISSFLPPSLSFFTQPRRAGGKINIPSAITSQTRITEFLGKSCV